MGKGVMKTILREGTRQDLPFLREMLFEAVSWRSDALRPPMDEALSHPELAKLLEGWGREGDASVIAETAQNDPVGAAWYRFWSDCEHSYGYIGADIPELGIAVVRGMRRKGIGDRLLHALRKLAGARGIERLSLSVEEDNPARLLYLKRGFERVRVVGNAWTMVARTTTSRGHRKAARQT
jgi:GNAT superfamily N-acetyltransferase